MNTARLQRTQNQLKAQGIDALALVPGPNMYYVSGIIGHLSERPTVFILRADGAVGLITPSFEAPQRAQELGPAAQLFRWTDEAGYEGAFAEACATLQLAGRKLCIEFLHMRAIEVKAFEQYAVGAQCVALEKVFPNFRALKDADEVAHMRKATEIMETALRAAMNAIKVGVTESEVAVVYRNALMNAGSEDNPFGPIVASGRMRPILMRR